MGFIRILYGRILRVVYGFLSAEEVLLKSHLKKRILGLFMGGKLNVCLGLGLSFSGHTTTSGLALAFAAPESAVKLAAPAPLLLAEVSYNLGPIGARIANLCQAGILNKLEDVI